MCRCASTRPTVRPFGILVWLHGGGWVIGSVADSDVTARELADGAGVAVVSVDYRLAPEHRFPAAVDDSLAATDGCWPTPPSSAAIRRASPSGATRPAATWPPSSASSSGDRLAFQLLVYPATDAAMSTPSCTENGEGYLLTKASMEWFYGHYLEGTGTDVDRRAPLAAGLERLRRSAAGPGDHGRVRPVARRRRGLRRQLAAASVPVTTSRYDGMIHAFFSLARHRRGEAGDGRGHHRASAAPSAAEPGHRAARVKTASSIGSVSRPVNVFCWLGWNEHISRAAARPDARHLERRVRSGAAAARPSAAARRLVAERTQAHDDPQVAQQGAARVQVGAAAVTLVRRRLVGRRRALHRRRDPGAGERETVVADSGTSAGWPARRGTWRR